MKCNKLFDYIYSGLILFLITSSASALADQKVELLQIDLNNKISAPRNSVSWYPGEDNKQLRLHFKGKLKPDFLEIGRNHPNSTRFLVISGSNGIQLPVEFSSNFKGFDNFGDLKDGYKIQATEHDFDGDRNPELVFAVGNGLTDLSVCVIKYITPASVTNPVELRNWKVLGEFTGQQKATLTSSGIIFPYGSRGLFREHRLVRGRFVEKK